MKSGKYLLGGLLTKGIKSAYKKYRTRGGRKVADRFKKRVESYTKLKAEIPSKNIKTIIKLKSKQDIRKGIRSSLKKKSKDRRLILDSQHKSMPKLLSAIGKELSLKQNIKKGKPN